MPFTNRVMPIINRIMPMINRMMPRILQEGGRVQGKESVCWEVGVFLVCCFHCFESFLVSKNLGFEMFWFQSFEDLPNFQFMISGRYWSHVQDFQNCLRRISMICRCRPLQICVNFGIPQFREFEHNIGVIHFLLSRLGDTFKKPEIIEMLVLGFSHKQIEKL